jgi:PKD repeat protein
MPTRRPRPRLAPRLLAPALALLALCSLPAAARADGWVRGPALTFADDPSAGLAGGFSDLGADAAGTASLAWVAIDRAAMSLDVRLTRIAPDGSAAPSLSFGAATDVPALAVATSGATALAWPDADEALQLVTLPAAGTPRPALIVAPGPARDVGVGVSDQGDAVVIWTDAGRLHLRRVAANGQLGPHETIADADPEVARVAVARDGSAWVAWVDYVDGIARAVRLTAAGAVDGAPVELSAARAVSLDVVAGADSAVVTWTEAAGVDDKALLSRLSASGPVAGAAIEIAAAIEQDSVPEAAPAPNGGIDVVYQPPTPSGGSGMFSSAHAVLRRVEPSGALGPERRLAAGAATLGTMSPRISTGRDGTATVTWVDVSSSSIALVGFQQRPDGTQTQARTVSGIFPLFGLIPNAEVAQVVTSRLGVATTAWPEITDRTADVVTARYDGIAPVVEAVVPLNVSYGSDAQFAVNVRDDSGVKDVWWEFGDDSGSRRATVRHRYAAPGVYPVSVTVTDNAGNETTVTRQLSVVSPPPLPNRVAAALKLGSVSRKGARVTVSGTLDRRASGTVTVAYSQRIGRRSLSKRVTARIANGRFRATLRLTGRLARARGGKATIAVSYAGNADTNTASAKKTVNVPKAKKKPKRGAKRR